MDRLSALDIFTQIMIQFTPVWIGLALILTLSIIFKSRLGLYGKLYGSRIGLAGLILVLFWVLTAIFADLIATMDPLTQISGMKNKKPGWPVRDMEGHFYLLGGDNDNVIKDTQLLAYFKAIDTMPDDIKGSLLKVIDAYVRDYRTQQAYK